MHPAYRLHFFSSLSFKPIRKVFAAILVTGSIFSSQAQQFLVQASGDSTTAERYAFNKKRVKLIAATNVIGYSAAMAGLYSAWYKDYPQSKFHTFNDIDEWKQIDKFGHVYSAY